MVKQEVTINKLTTVILVHTKNNSTSYTAIVWGQYVWCRLHKTSYYNKGRHSLYHHLAWTIQSYSTSGAHVHPHLIHGSSDLSESASKQHLDRFNCFPRSSHACTHARTHACTHARTHTHRCVTSV